MSIKTPDQLAAKLNEEADSEDKMIETLGFVFVDYLDCGTEKVGKFLDQFGEEMKEEFISSVGKYARDNGLANCLQN